MPVRRIFIECTHTYYNGKYTGIQRVVRALAAQAKEAGQAKQIECYPLVWGFWGFLQIDHLPKEGKFAFRWVKNITRSLYRLFFPDRPPPILPTSPLPPPTTMMPAGPTTPKSKFLPKPSSKIVWLRRVSYLFASIFCHSPKAVLTRRVHLGAGDVLLLADASWNQPLWADLEKVQARGCQVGVLIYDVLAATDPEWFDPPLAASFQDWLARALAQCQFYVGISEATRQAVADLAPAIAAAHPQLPTNPRMRSGSFRLGVDLTFHPNPKAVNTNPLPETAPLFVPDRRRCLAVGTIEPRKNHRFLLEGFTLAAERDPALDLILVGRPGWRCQDLVQQIREHPLFGKRLFWFSDLDDAGLETCFAQSDLLVCLSLAEGFGLPIIEGLSRGLPVVCSDLPVFREVGGSFVRYVPLGNPEALAAQLITTSRLLAVGSSSNAEFKWPDWQASTQELLEVMVRLSAREN